MKHTHGLVVVGLAIGLVGAYIVGSHTVPDAPAAEGAAAKALAAAGPSVVPAAGTVDGGGHPDEVQHEEPVRTELAALGGVDVTAGSASAATDADRTIAQLRSVLEVANLPPLPAGRIAASDMEVVIAKVSELNREIATAHEALMDATHEYVDAQVEELNRQLAAGGPVQCERQGPDTRGRTGPYDDMISFYTPANQTTTFVIRTPASVTARPMGAYRLATKGLEDFADTVVRAMVRDR